MLPPRYITRSHRAALSSALQLSLIGQCSLGLIRQRSASALELPHWAAFPFPLTTRLHWAIFSFQGLIRQYSPSDLSYNQALLGISLRSTTRPHRAKLLFPDPIRYCSPSVLQPGPIGQRSQFILQQGHIGRCFLSQASSGSAPPPLYN